MAGQQFFFAGAVVVFTGKRQYENEQRKED
jgi:hypothetical protein